MFKLDLHSFLKMNFMSQNFLSTFSQQNLTYGSCCNVIYNPTNCVFQDQNL